MALVNASLLVGALFVAIPIILHLTMRQRPKHFVFPALRFVLPRREANTRKLQLRRWLLLALRCAAVLLLAFALARPSVTSHMLGAWVTVGALTLLTLVTAALALMAGLGRRGGWLTVALAALATILGTSSIALAVTSLVGSSKPTGQASPVAAVLVFDTSPRMAYRHEDMTRLERAGETARWLMGQLPADSEVAVLDSRTRSAVFSVNAAAAAKSAERLQVSYVPNPMGDVLESALQLALSSSKSHKEIYVFTDRAAVAWNKEELTSFREQLAKATAVSLFVVDVGVERPMNVALGDLKLSSETMPRDGEVMIETDVRSEATTGERIVELAVEQPDPSLPLMKDGKIVVPTLRQRDGTACNLEPGQTQPVRFALRGLEVGVHQGQVRVLGKDGLSIDDVRYFTVRVQDAWPILLAAPENASMNFVSEALAPYDLRERGTAPFDTVQRRIEDLNDTPLGDYAAVCLLDPPPLPDEVWNRLAEYVRGGGGLALILGHHVKSVGSFSTESAQQLLAGSLTRQWRAAGRELFLAPTAFQHPVTAPFRESASSTPWQLYPIFRHWGINPLAENASEIMRYGNGQIAIAERFVGKGKVITMTTPLSDTARPAGRLPWNELAFGENPWPQFILVNEMMSYLVASGQAKLNYFVGQAVTLPHRQDLDPPRFQLFPPDGETYDVVGANDVMVLRFTETPGAYRLKGNRGGVVIRGFAANLPAAATRLERATPDILAEALGKGRFQEVRQRQQIQRAQGRERAGREFYPLLVVMLALVLGLEHTMANRFYRQQEH